MDTEAFVYVDLDGEPVLMGRLWVRKRRGRDSASFDMMIYEPHFHLQLRNAAAECRGMMNYLNSPMS